MAEENVKPGESKNTAFGNVLCFTERTGKAIAVLTATSYVIGYIVTAVRLAQGGVPTTRLIDAQYFAAGFLPGLLVWVTMFVVASACHYEPRQEDGSLKSLWNYAIWFLVLLFLTAIIIEVLNGLARERWSDSAQSLLSISDNLIKLVLGQLALWYLVAGLRSKVLWELIKALKNVGEGYYNPVLWFILLSLGLALIGMWRIVPTTWMAYILDLVKDGKRGAWVLKANVVYAVVETPQK